MGAIQSPFHSFFLLSSNVFCLNLFLFCGKYGSYWWVIWIYYMSKHCTQPVLLLTSSDHGARLPLAVNENHRQALGQGADRTRRCWLPSLTHLVARIPLPFFEHELAEVVS
jgi:hypothetical protein